jgi:hypothetical protein
MTGKSREESPDVPAGRWRIVAMDRWEQDDVDLIAPGFIGIRPSRTHLRT